jgi:ribosomal protein S18 acetylase RimI-like enzyme
MEIRRYRIEDEDALIQAIKAAPDWQMFTNDKAIDTYKRRLSESTTYVCYAGETFAGYVRALLDDDLAIYISELFVVPAWRNRAIGRRLIGRVRADFDHLVVYVLSDEDLFYRRLGFKRIGSVFEVHGDIDRAG